MPEEQPKDPHNDPSQNASREEAWRLRRIRRAERKESLPPSPPLFLPDENERTEQDIQLPPPDLSLLPSHDDAPQQLKQAEGITRPVKITPRAERYPPLPDALPDTDTPPSPTPSSHPPSTPSVPPPSTHTRTYNALSLVFVIATLALCAIYSAIWLEPQSILNPFPPEIRTIFITATPDAIAQPPPMPTNQPPDTLYPFAVASDGIVYIPNANGRECQWASIAGIVLSADGQALNGYRVRVTDGDGTTETVFTGATLTFGAGGFEYPIGGAPVEARYTLQLFSPQDAPLSEPVQINTQSTCETNVVVVTFEQVN